MAEIGVFERDLRTGVAWWSPQLIELFGLGPEGGAPETLDGSMKRILAEDAPALRAALERASDSGESDSIDIRYLRSGEVRHAEIRIEALVADGGPVGYRGTMQDQTARTLEAAEATRELNLRSLQLDAVNAAVVATDREGFITHWNAAAERMYGWSAEEALGQPLLAIATGADTDQAEKIMNSFIATGSWDGDYEAPHRDGSSVAASVRLATVPNAEGDPDGVVSVSVDISKRVEMENDLRGARDYLKAVTANMAEGLITLDSDGRLAYMNDAADGILGWREEGLIGEPIAKLANHRPAEVTGDWGTGFAVAALAFGDQPTRVESELIVARDHHEIEITYTAAPFKSELGELGTVIVFSDVTEQRSAERSAREKLEGLSWIGKVRDALDADRMVPFAQPIVPLSSPDEPYRHELLVRMLDEQDRPIEPARFLPVAEEFGLIVEIDELMVRRGVELASRGHRVSINLSAQSIAKPGMSDLIGAEIDRTGADPSFIVVELTETALIESEHAARRFVERLAILGCGFALDDFGTGYGGFMYLKQLPIDFLKIDMEFVHDLTVNQGSQRVVRAVVDLASGFGQKTIAEGIEDEETRDLLTEMGVDYGQGLLFGAPAPAHEAFAHKIQEARNVRQPA